jgi:hypothetical protein
VLVAARGLERMADGGGIDDSLVGEEEGAVSKGWPVTSSMIRPASMKPLLQ